MTEILNNKPNIDYFSNIVEHHEKFANLNTKQLEKPKLNPNQEIILDNGSLILEKKTEYLLSIQQQKQHTNDSTSSIVYMADQEIILENANSPNQKKPQNPSPMINVFTISPEEESKNQSIRDINNNPKNLFTGNEEKTEKTEVDIFNIDNNDENDIERYPRLVKIIENNYFQWLMFVFICWALFSYDIQLLAFSASADNYFDCITIISFVAFCIELIIMSIAMKEYRWSIFFWIDIISTLTLLFDISWIHDLIFNYSFGENLEIGRTSKISRIGARSARIIRIMRSTKQSKTGKNNDGLIKQKNSIRSTSTQSKNNNNHHHDISCVTELININQSKEEPIISASNDHEIENNLSIIALQKASIKSNNLAKVMPINIKPIEYDDNLEYSKPESKSEFQKLSSINYNSLKSFEQKPPESKESKIGKRLSELTSARVVILVLGLIILMPLFNTDFYTESSISSDYIVNEIRNIFQNTSINSTTKNLSYWNFINIQANAGYPIVYMNLSNIEYNNPNISPSDLRINEKHTTSIISTTDSSLIYIAVIDLRKFTSLQAGLLLGRTLFVCVVLVLGSFFFAKDIDDLLLKPIERMITKINELAKNPLVLKCFEVSHHKKTNEKNEIIQIENAIVKIGTFLALGFGEAGSDIIALNLSKGGDVDPMIPGIKKYAIFGFCDIRNFTDSTEVLQEEVMVFVNTIANIVHRYVDKYAGSANKNIGDAFLLVWKFDPLMVNTQDDGTVRLVDIQVARNIADLALIAFLKIYARINKDPVILRYKDDQRLNQRLVNYKVKMGFGLHFGWAIEGAIGSEFKIDASYLSPNVNMASRLEAATKQYGVSILFSGDMANCLSSETREKCRLIDIVTVKGSVKPVELWTVDVNSENLGITKPRNESKAERKLIQQEKKIAIRTLYLDSDERASNIFDSDKDLLAMVNLPIGPFYDAFNSGFENYINGEWNVAKIYFKKCLELNPSDGPTRTLYEVMKENYFSAPSDWLGYRQLMEK